jgi:hypothetical protein
MITITEEMREAARQLLKTAKIKNGADLDLLTKIANGKRKLIDGGWWKEIHNYVFDQPKRAKLAALADPARNDNPHERAVASAMLSKFKGRRPPGLHPEPPPLPPWEKWVRYVKVKPTAKSAKPKTGPVNTTGPSTARPAAVNTTQAGGPSKAKPVSTTKPPVSTTQAGPSTKPVNTTKPRSADRHREPNRDRHSPGYMREYMRHWRAARSVAGRRHE